MYRIDYKCCDAETTAWYNHDTQQLYVTDDIISHYFDNVPHIVYISEERSAETQCTVRIDNVYTECIHRGAAVMTWWCCNDMVLLQ